ncbi:tubulin binding cofactor A-domain-containing protein [Tricharina praecox]|uniref:tubulin binding cofactor A-domain-containing protein n=1 Tax=Tricharina praecox TaxID=43433 RepID=UPI00221EF29A|nr:tubulin binding cofactor A-domain-containing protein [Tricharina praecox]KAI5849742.1 tubulin binding cofactor A-domain-containing protein [Tricharina praecox]
MAPPTALAIKTSAVMRLIKEESMYHKELVLEKNRLAKMEADGESDEYAIKQQTKVVEETKGVVPALREKLLAAVEVLEGQLDAAADVEPEANKGKARKAIEDGRKTLVADL